MKKIDLIRRIVTKNPPTYQYIRKELESHGFIGGRLTAIAIQVYCQRSSTGSWMYRDLSKLGTGYQYKDWCKLPIDLDAVKRIRKSTIKLNFRIYNELRK